MPIAQAPDADVAIVGLGVMGWNLGRNLQRHGFAVAGFDLDAGRRERFARETGGRAPVSMAELVAAVRRPRRVLLMLPAGGAVDAVLGELRPLLAPGDLVIDGGNTRYTDTHRRMGELTGSGILFVGAGVSGGHEGALNGPSIMPGGDALAWPVVQPMLQAIAARADDGQPCCEWMGAGGAGHFVKMVHNGIEYADMQLICEAWWLLHTLWGMQPRDVAQVFADWNRGELDSYLLGISAELLARTDADTGRPLVEVIVDAAEQKGTGKWATEAALDLGVAVPAMGDAVFARAVSAARATRAAAAVALPGAAPAPGVVPVPLEELRMALLAARLCAYVQGFELLAAADREYQWQLPLPAVAAVWRAGCIIRARVLDDLRAACERGPQHLLLDAPLGRRIGACQQGLRTTVTAAALHGIPVPAFMGALAWYDGLRSARLPASLLQAQRDFFGAHGFARLDRPGSFHLP